MRNQNQKPVATPAQQIASCRGTLLLVVLLTAVNMVLSITKSNTSFLFSATVPYYLVVFGAAMDEVAGASVYAVTGVVVGALILGVYVLIWAMSKKHPGWLKAAAVLFAVDTAALLALAVWSGDFASVLLDLVFHAYALYLLVKGAQMVKKLGREPVDAEPLREETASGPDLDA